MTCDSFAADVAVAFQQVFDAGLVLGGATFAVGALFGVLCLAVSWRGNK